MNVQDKYTSVVSAGGSSVFFRLLAIWHGSLYKLLWVDLGIYIALYFVLSLAYRFAMNRDQQSGFRDMMCYCQEIRSSIPINFILGFFVAGIIARWWRLWESIPRIGTVAYVVQAFMEGHGNPQLIEKTDAQGKVKRDVDEPEKHDPTFSERARFHMMRYIMLSWILMMTTTSEQIMKRFKFDSNVTQRREALKKEVEKARELGEEPDVCDIEQQQQEALQKFFDQLNNDAMVRKTFGALVTDDEKQVFITYFHNQRLTYRNSNGLEYWLPLQWATRIVQKAVSRGYTDDPKAFTYLVGVVERLRRDMQSFIMFTNLNIPLVYVHVVIIVVYTYFVIQLFASQFDLTPGGRKGKGRANFDMVVPIFDFLVVMFLMGWFRVALCVMNPFGDDDEDFDISTILDENMKRCYDAAISQTFPDHLERAQFTYYQEVEGLDDNLNEFVMETDKQLKILEAAELAPSDNAKLSKCGALKACFG